MYLWDLEPSGFAGVILIKKGNFLSNCPMLIHLVGDGSKKIKGCWDSIHVFEVQVRRVSDISYLTLFRKKALARTLTTS